MFTLCMSRGANKNIQDNAINTNHCGKQIKGGYLLRHKRGWLCRTWCEEWVVLYEDSTVAWFKDKGAAIPGGRVRLSDAPELLAVGEWTRQVPRRPRIPADCHVGQLMALGGCSDYGEGGGGVGSYDGYGRKSRVHWLMAQSPAEVSDWMTAISNTLPPPPRLTIDRDKRCSITLTRDYNRCGNGCSNYSSLSRLSTTSYPAPSSVIDTLASRRSYDTEHTVPPGVVIDWGHGWGWGWGDAAWAAQIACGASDSATVAAASALYCAAAEDFSIGGGYDDVVDYSACGDFSF